MIYIRNAEEIQKIAEAGQIVATVLKTMETEIVPGVTTEQLDKTAERIIKEMGAKPSFKGYNGFPKSICTSVNETLIHGIPGSRVLVEGDIISIDVGACYQGYHADSARTYAVGKVSAAAKKLMNATEHALMLALEQVKEGNKIGDISHAIQTYIEAQGYTLPKDFTGHGVGRNLHEDPAIPNSGEKGTGVRLKAGMILAIEPMVNSGLEEVEILKDNWTVNTIDGKLSAHYEHTVVVEKDGCQILSTIKEGK